MDTTTRQKAKWTERLRAVFTFRKRQNTNNHRPAEIPSKGISLNAIVAAENALRWIPVGGARDGIGAFLNVVKEIYLTTALDNKTLLRLEINVRLLAELLEPLVYLEPHMFPADLQHEVRRLSRELRVISQKMRPSLLGTSKGRLVFSNQTENTSGDVVASANEFSLVLDRFQVIALPMYTVSTMEAAIRPLGIVSNSSCGLLPFIDWIRLGRGIDYRFGLIRTVRLCYRSYRVGKARHRDHTSNPSIDRSKRAYYILHIGLLNGRGIQNWLEIELARTSTRGTVTFAATSELLVDGAISSGAVLIIEEALSLVELVMQIEQIPVDRHNSHLFSLDMIYDVLGTYGRQVVDPMTTHTVNQEEETSVVSSWDVTDDTIRHEIL